MIALDSSSDRGSMYIAREPHVRTSFCCNGHCSQTENSLCNLTVITNIETRISKREPPPVERLRMLHIAETLRTPLKTMSNFPGRCVGMNVFLGLDDDIDMNALTAYMNRVTSTVEIDKEDDAMPEAMSENGEDISVTDDEEAFMSATEDILPTLEPGLMYGDNDRPQLITSGDACLNLFGTWVPSSDTSTVEEKLELAWAENNLLTLKVIFHKGNVRDGGSGDFLNFIRAFMWLFRNHPKTALENVQHIPRNSSLQTLLLITKFLMYDPKGELVDTLFSSTPLSDRDVEEYLKHSQLETHKISTGINFPRQKGYDHHSEHSVQSKRTHHIKKQPKTFRRYRQWRHIVHVQEFMATHRPGCGLEEVYKKREYTSMAVMKNTPKNITAKVEAKRIKAARVQATRQGITKFVETHQDGNLANMITTVRDIFVDGMVMELNEMLAQDPNSKACNGLFHKWAPTRGGSVDTATNLGYLIQQELTRRIAVVSDDSRASIQDSLCGHIPRLATMTRQMKYERILRMMRKRSFIPESFIGAQKFHDVDYAYMPGKCLSVHGKDVFCRNDKDRYTAHFKSISDTLDAALKFGDTDVVKAATKSVKVDSTETHTILRKAMQSYRDVKCKLDVEKRKEHDMFRSIAGGNKNAKNTNIEDEESQSTVLKLQFINLLSQFISSKKSKGSSWIPVVDTSGSMDCIMNPNVLAKPMDVAITLGLLVSMANDPLSKWFCRMVTFNQTPDIYHILHGIEDGEFEDDSSESETDIGYRCHPNTLEVKLNAAMEPDVTDINGMIDLLNTDTFMLGKIVSGVKNMPWGGNTDLVAVFKKQLAPLMEAQTQQSLSLAEETLLRDRIANENMIIFTDMQFDDSDGHRSYNAPRTKNPAVYQRGLLIMEEITEMYSKCGIDKVPKIVFWNLNAEVGAPSGSGVSGVTMVTGYSPAMLKCFLEDDLDGYNPIEYLVHQMDNAAYQGLRVCD
ncbi:hypothetical protein T484DRAFT_1756516 [Baffinella frigidus]|nr:hypothetical protein T484DRAFT_1756516 [Cryptophyta sp. CCMP2293]